MLMKPGFELAIHESRFADQVCLFMDHFKHFFVKFASQNFHSAKIFAFRETTKFLFTFQARQFVYILLQKVLKCILFSCILIAFWPQTCNG